MSGMGYPELIGFLILGLIAIRSLLSLMENHRLQFRQRKQKELNVRLTQIEAELLNEQRREKMREKQKAILQEAIQNNEIEEKRQEKEARDAATAAQKTEAQQEQTAERVAS